MKIINNYDGSSIDIINEDLRKNEAVAIIITFE